jgi:DNA repair exonuclease SbcCD ATPase subunit
VIVFKAIRFKNFLSTGDEFNEINLNTNPTTLVMGKNGSGKSTMLDALTYALFGEPFRNINVPNLINDTNEREMIVEVDFTIGRTRYMVRRGLKPRTFEIYINDQMVDQEAKARDYQKYLEQSILKLNKKSFTQVVVLGSASFVPFMQLPTSDRRFIIEDLLDIQIFSAMNQVLKNRVNEMRDEHSNLVRDIEVNEEKVGVVQSYLKRIRADNVSAIQYKNQTVAENGEQKEALNDQIEQIRSEIKEQLATIADQPKVKQRIKKLETAEDKLKTNLSKAIKEKDFFETTNECPTCKQGIDDIFKSEVLDRKAQLVIDIENALTNLEGDIKKSEERMNRIGTTLRVVSDLENKISKMVSSIRAIDTYVKKVQKEIEELRERGNGNDEEHEEKLRVLQKSLSDSIRDRDELTEKKHYLDIVAVMLKDTGIKTKIIRQYLPIINKYVNRNLSAMDFFANFTLDENFKEVIHIRGSKERTYYQLSEGQKLRIDLAILFTWREVSRLKNSANTNLLIMDEIFESALDDSGVDDFLKLLQTMGKETNIFIISPKGDQLIDKFAHTIKFIEEKGFSVMNV